MPGFPISGGALVPGTDVSTGTGDGGRDDGDSPGHGTQMASLIASRGTGTGFVGVAPEAKIMSVRTPGVNVDKAIRFAADHGAKVINISQGYPRPDNKCPDEIQLAVDYALQRDVVIVAAAGNNGNVTNHPEAPANCAGVLAVGAIDNQKRAWEKTARQSFVEVAAPGVYVGGVNHLGQVLTAKAGTSPASALTSAVAALIRSKYPQMPNREVVQRIINTAKDAGPPGRDEMTGNGAVIPAAALTADVPKTAPNPVFERYDQWRRTHAQAARRPGQNTPTKSAFTKREEQAAQRTKLLLGALGGVALLAVLLVVVLAIAKRRKPAAAGPMPGGTPGGTPGQQPGPPVQPPGWGGQVGPPPAGQAPQHPSGIQQRPPAGPPQ
ncbi:MAG TPA: S8 family serine peptidase [Spirillospora sp.]